MKNIGNNIRKLNKKIKPHKAPEPKQSLIITTVIIIMSLLLFLYCISLLVPLFWMLFTSVKDDFEYVVNPLWPSASGIRLENYVDVIRFLKVTVNSGSGIVEYGILDMFVNSILLAVGSPLISLVLVVFCAYPMARFKFVGNKLIYTIGIIVMVTPIFGTFPSIMMVKRSLGIYDNMLLMLLTNDSVAFSGYNFLIFYAAFRGIPKDFSDAAEIDGANQYLIMFKIMMPMILPTFTTLFVLGFIASWNDYGTPLYWLPSYPNIPYGMYLFQLNATAGGDAANIPLIMAGFTIVMIPVVILYLLSQKVITKNFTMGGIKG